MRPIPMKAALTLSFAPRRLPVKMFVVSAVALAVLQEIF